MLASITPLGERGRHARWGVTVTTFLIGSTAAGAAFGALAGGLAALALPSSFTADSRLAVLAAAALLAVALDAVARRVPGPRRQVDERWLDSYRSWVYGLGFGAQLGFGVTTVVASAALYLALLAAVLSGDPAAGAAVLGTFGLVRGLSPLAAARVRLPHQLVALHAALSRWRAPARRAGLGATAAIAALSILGSAA
jgi:hypothetical protein